MAVNIGPKIGIDGEAEYRKQINNIIQQGKTLGSQMKVVAAEFAASGNAQQKAASTAEIYTKQIAAQQERVDLLAKMLGEASKKFGETDTATLKWQQALNEATATLTTMKKNLADVNAEIGESNTKSNAFSASAKSLGNSIYLTATKLKTGKNETAALKSAFRDAKQDVANLTKEFNDTAKQTGKTSTETKELAEKLEDAKAKMERLKGEFRESRNESSLFAKAVGAAGSGLKTIGSTIGTGLAASLKATVGAMAAAGTAVVGLGKIGLEYNSQMEKYTTNFEVMLGSTEAAAEKVESLKTMAAKTPFEMTGLADATQQLLAMGVANEDTNKYLQQLGDISLGDAEKLGTLVNSFGKMNSTGKVTLEYINMMAEQGFNPLNLIAEETGETMTELYERLSDGGVSFDEIKQAMETATSAGGQFYQGMEQASQTTEGMIATLQDNATALVGEVFQPISESLKDDLIPTAIDAVDKLTTAFQEDGVEGMIAAAGDIIGELLGQFSDALPKFVESAVSIVKSLLSGIDKNMDSIADGAVSTIEALINGFVDMLPDIIVTGTLLIGKLAAGLVQAIPQIVEKIPDIIKAIKDGFASKAGEWLEIGKNIVRGLVDGLLSLAGWLGDKVSGLFGGTVKTAKAELDIHSPSGVFEEIGEYSALGYGKGWENKIKGIRAEVGKGLDFGSLSTGAKLISPTSTTSNAVNYGGINIVVHGAQGQDVNQLADVIMQRIDRAVRRKEAVFGAV